MININYLKKNKKLKVYYNWFLLGFFIIFMIREISILVLPKPYLVVKQYNDNNIININNEDKKVDGTKIYGEKKIHFNDENLQKVLKNVLGISDDEDIYSHDLEKVISLDLVNSDIEDLEGIQYCVNMEKLNLSGNKLRSIKELSTLKKLKSLNLFNNKIADLDGLKNLINLTELDLAQNNIKSIEVLRNLKNLEELNLHNNCIENVSPIGSLKKLHFLDVSRNKIKDISILECMNIKMLLKWCSNIDVL